MKSGYAIALKLIILLTILCFSLPSSGGEIQQQLTRESTLEQVMKRRSLRVGMSTFVPWAMKDKKGRLIGFEIDVAKRLAEDMGVKAEFIPTKWAGIIPSLLTGKFDVIIGGMGILPKRNLKVNFSIPYDYSGMSIVANRKLAKGFTGIDDFNQPGVKLSAVLGSTGALAVKKYMPKAQLREFDNESQIYQEVVNGKVHGAVGSAPTPAFHALKFKEKLFLPLEETFTKEPIGFALRKGDPDTLNFFNNWIRIVEAEGWLKERKYYWFNTRKWEDQIQ